MRHPAHAVPWFDFPNSVRRIDEAKAKPRSPGLLARPLDARTAGFSPPTCLEAGAGIYFLNKK
jgi:hypothetical protein